MDIRESLRFNNICDILDDSTGTSSWAANMAEERIECLVSRAVSETGAGFI